MVDGTQRTVTARIVEQLRDMILHGEIPPGSRVDQADLAAQFGVSVVPVREALARLQSSGLVRIVPHRGAFVEELSASELVDIYTVRELLEEHAARLAADQIGPAEIAQLEQISAAMARETEAGGESGDFAAFLRLNREFHFTIYRASHRHTLLTIITQLWDRSTRYRHLQLHVAPERAQGSRFETDAILAACRRRDRDAIGYLVRYKIHQTTVSLLDVIHTAPGIGAARAGL